VMPLMLSMNALVLHASASLIDRCAVAFTGHCGVGKSTLAAILARRGHPVLSDDALLVRPRGAHLEAVPSYAGLRLWPGMMAAFSRGAATLPVDAASTKRRLKGDLGFHDGPAPLGCVYLVSPDPSSDVMLSPLSARDTAMVFVEHGFRIEQRDGAALTREMDTACGAAARVPAWRLSYPREEEQWDLVARRIAAHARDTVANPCCT
jgi:energy-coupling factor transporter ATP-binding protein EcfA2